MELQKKFDQLEEMGVLKHPGDLNVALDKLNPSFLVKKLNSGFRLVMAFTDAGRYGKPQPSLMPDVDSTFAPNCTMETHNHGSNHPFLPDSPYIQIDEVLPRSQPLQKCMGLHSLHNENAWI